MSIHQGRLQLSLACGDYEITRPLVEGRIRPDGIDLVSLTRDTERIFRRERRRECDVAEHNLFAFLADHAAGDDVVAIPVFPHRRFRLGSIFVPATSIVRDPHELAGGRIGIGGYQPAAAVWLRGILEDHYELPAETVNWYDVFGRVGQLPDGLAAPLPADDPSSRFEIDRFLVDGRLDAMISAYDPAGLRASAPTVRRLFDDVAAHERAYYRDTGLFPIMHVITLRRSLVQRHPWVPASLFEAFVRSRHEALQRLTNPRTLPLAFGQSAWQEQAEILGPDPWQYGLTEANRRVLATAVDYAVRQRLIPGPVTSEELFAPVDAEVAAGHEIR
ncbi:hypothetical protein WIS52_19625 [Pseudonocardia nematodicida]|uniref:4,5-dihydroxyphthalate decarboxylase n=1 Tax=Pseudonocardia nematodicida TaxID=1206997 RepID=A0ABV1KFN5_9PSEU